MNGSGATLFDVIARFRGLKALADGGLERVEAGEPATRSTRRRTAVR